MLLAFLGKFHLTTAVQRGPPGRRAERLRDLCTDALRLAGAPAYETVGGLPDAGDIGSARKKQTGGHEQQESDQERVLRHISPVFIFPQTHPLEL